MSDLDDLLADALDELDLDDAADEVQKTADTERAALIDKIKKKNIKYNPKSWQECLSLLSVEEKIEWTKTVSGDIVEQTKMKLKPAFSTAYGSGVLDTGKQNQNGITAFLQAGADAIKPEDNKSLLQWCVRKSLEENKKSTARNFEPSEELMQKFKLVVTLLIKTRMKFYPDDLENVQAQSERFSNLMKIASS